MIEDAEDEKIIDLSRLTEDYAKIALFVYMTHPSDVKAREVYGAYFLSKLDYGMGNPISNERLGLLLDGAGIGVADDFAKATPGGCIAGDVLIARLEMIMAGIADAGLDKAQHITSHRYVGAFDESGRAFKAKRDTVRDHWKRYGRAAHIWAAYLIMLRSAEAQGLRNSPDKWLDGSKLAGIALTLWKMSKVEVGRNAAPVLPPDAFEIVGVEPQDMTVELVKEWLDKELEDFAPRYRTS